MSKLEDAIITLHSFSRGNRSEIAPVALLLVTLVYLVALLSIPLSEPQRVVWMAVYPVVSAEMLGLGYGRLFVRSLWVVPLVALIGIFNPWLDHAEAFRLGSIVVSRGWVSFVGILLRGMLAMQAAVLLAWAAGFQDLCRAMMRLGIPRVLASQILFTYRYLMVVLEEALWMDRARRARGYGKRFYSIQMWSRLVGQLLIRSYERAGRIHRAMLARGFSGTLPFPDNSDKIGLSSWLFFGVWSVVILLLRFIDISEILTASLL